MLRSLAAGFPRGRQPEFPMGKIPLGQHIFKNFFFFFLSKSSPLSLQPGVPESGARPTEMPQPQQAEEDQLASGDTPPPPPFRPSSTAVGRNLRGQLDSLCSLDCPFYQRTTRRRKYWQDVVSKISSQLEVAGDDAEMFYQRLILRQIVYNEVQLI